jgi:membrane protease YdiL (CAAX protease family)
MPTRRVRRTADSGARLRALRGALAWMAGMWSVLALVPALAGCLGPAAARLTGFGLATALALAAASRPMLRAHRPRQAVAALSLGAAVGWILHPALCAWIAVLGWLIGLEAVTAWPAPGASGQELLAALVLAPVFEEILYRARLLSALRAVVGAGPALLASSALFALPHLEPWALLGTFVAGGLLGAAWLAFEDVFLCIGLHAGMNLSAQTWAGGAAT